jgi:hypothetical protein
MLRSGFTTLQPTCASLTHRTPLKFANRVFSLADGNVEYLLGNLDGIAWTFGHETSMPQAALPIYAMRFQTDT